MMVADLGSYLLELVAAAILTAISSSLLPKGRLRDTVRLAGALAIAVVLLRPFAQLDLADLSRVIGQVQMEYSELSSGIKVNGLRVQGQVISQQAEAYILTKAEELGLAVTVEVEVRQGDFYACPWQVTISGTVSDRNKEVLGQYIEGNLAIPTERQIWIP